MPETQSLRGTCVLGGSSPCWLHPESESLNRMIFGFNTDIRHEDTIYHVQSEAREGEHLLQTQVFVRGRCIGKRAVPYGSARRKASTSPNDIRTAESKKEQEKKEKDAARTSSPGTRCHPRRQARFHLRQARYTGNAAAVKELDLEWINAGSVHSSGALTMHFRVTEGGATVEGARLDTPVRPARRHALLRAGSHRRQRQRRDERSGG